VTEGNLSEFNGRMILHGSNRAVFKRASSTKIRASPFLALLKNPRGRGLLGLHGLADGPTAMGTHVNRGGLDTVESVSCLARAY
jgi:hypothetical protein